MMDEIETILKHDVEFKESERVHHRYDIGEKEYYVEQGKSLDIILDAIHSLQQSLPDDLKERREAAAKHLSDPSMAEWDYHRLLNRFEKIVGDLGGIDTASQRAAWMTLLYCNKMVPTKGEKEYYDPSPDYPEQWLEHMSEESAEWLAGWLKKHGFSTVTHPQSCSPPKELKRKDLVVWCRNHPEVRAYATRAVFTTNAFELPDFIDEEEL